MTTAAFATTPTRLEYGVDFSARRGALCPCCGGRAPVYRSMPWEDGLRVRYHRCVNPHCPLAALGGTIKSVQREY